MKKSKSASQVVRILKMYILRSQKKPLNSRTRLLFECPFCVSAGFIFQLSPMLAGGMAMLLCSHMCMSVLLFTGMASFDRLLSQSKVFQTHWCY